MNYKDTTSATANKPDKRMPGSKLFYDYIQACFQRLLQSMEKYHASKSVKALFRFRVSIKKIRTTLKCLEFYNGLNPLGGIELKIFQKDEARAREVLAN